MIPDRYHFVWFGRQLPLFAQLAMRSVLVRNPGAELIAWHGPELSSEERAELSSAGIEFRPIDVEGLIQTAGLADTGLLSYYRALTQPAALSNVVRLLVLYAEGGVYLDTDTLTLKDLTPLRREAGFCGLEHILWPREKLTKRSPYFWTVGPALEVWRTVSSALAQGYRLHRRSLRWYSQAANNAVLGFERHHPFLQAALQAIPRLPREDAQKRYRLGTHLLQQTLAERANEVTCFAPSYFYPLGPIASRHFFKERTDLDRVLPQVIRPETHVVHWYTSVSDLRSRDRKHIENRRDRSIYARLCAEVLEHPLR